MRYILSFMLLLACFACSDSSEDNIVTKDETYLTLSANIIRFSSSGGEKAIYIDSNAEWTVSKPDSCDWIEFSKDSQALSLSITAEENIDSISRNVILNIISQGQIHALSITQSGVEYLHTDVDETIHVASAKCDTVVTVDTNVSFKHEILDACDSWISISSGTGNNSFGNDLGWDFGSDLMTSTGRAFFDDDKLTISILENTDEKPREGRIRIYNDEFLIADTITIIQSASNSTPGPMLEDGSYDLYFNGESGDATLVVLGDGFTEKDIKSGYYMASLHSGAEHFFSIEPYTSYKDYFKVYTMVTVSKTEGVGEKGMLGLETITNRFETAFGDGTEIVCNSDAIFECARSIPGLETKPITVIVVLNSKKYAGTTYMFSHGSSIALCPMSDKESPNDFEGLVHHEAGGHAFAFLADEYIYNESTIPDSEKENMRQWQSLGFQKNLDFTSDPRSIFWSRFIGEDGYDMVGAYQGGALYRYGVWRCEENSCMNNNVPYFNTQSRWLIVNRLMELSGKALTFEDFVTRDRAMDLHPEAALHADTSTTSRSSTQPLQPLAPPKLIME